MKGRTVVAGLIGGIANFLLGWLIFGVLLMNWYTSQTTHYDGLVKEMPNLVLIFLSNLAIAFLVAIIYREWANVRTFMKGFLYGLVISFLFSVTVDFYIASMMNLYTTTLTVVDIIVSTIMGAVVNGLIGFVLGFGKKTE
jgi:hypothetical protein